MLLPSAMPCDRLVSTPKAQRPRLPSFHPYNPQSQSQTSYAGGLFASCRALHSILGGPVQPPALAITTSSLSIDPFAERLQELPRASTPPRGLNKRSRDEFEEDEKESTLSDPKYSIHCGNDRNMYQTPKRQRRVPIDIPAGLHASDFTALSTPMALQQPKFQLMSRRKRSEDVNMPPMTTDSLEAEEPSTSITLTSPIKTRSRRRSKDQVQSSSSLPSGSARLQLRNSGLQAEGEKERSRELWSPSDDRRLVEAVLSKLNLSKRDWNDCARQLGKDKDSLGKRWKLLVGEGNIGLRRGIGRHERNDLDITSW